MKFLRLNRRQSPGNLHTKMVSLEADPGDNNLIVCSLGLYNKNANSLLELHSILLHSCMLQNPDWTQSALSFPTIHYVIQVIFEPLSCYNR
jgi:hypothetical protein